jgi:hypothetical protein
MYKYLTAGLVIVSTLVFQACSRKTAPPPAPTTAATPTSPTSKAADSVAIVEMKAKMGIKAPVKTAVPKSIVVSDAAAKKTVDGRFYYDLEGKRYWRSKKDGKYYLYYKGMFENKDFQK